MVFEYLLPAEGQVGVEYVVVHRCCLGLRIICSITMGHYWYNRVQICNALCLDVCCWPRFCCLGVPRHFITHINY
jgi:hypothetical protein